MTQHITLEDCQVLDQQDPLAFLRDQFDIPQGVIYLDGNSLGAMPKAALACVQRVVTEEWAHGLIGSWNRAGWFHLPNRVGDKIAMLIGASAGQVLAVDSTSINLFKVLSVALQLSLKAHPQRGVVLSERSNFPTDLYLAHSLCEQMGVTLELCESPKIGSRLSQGDVAVLLLTHVNYRTGAMHDMAQLNTLAKRVGTLTVWDLAHSAGAVALRVEADGADFAVGCGYKYLNGGPGAPAFVWVHPQHTEQWTQPLAGWWGHAKPFTFSSDYQAARGIQRYACGTQPIISLAVLECGVDSLLAANPNGDAPADGVAGSIRALRLKSLALSDLFIALVEQRCAGLGLSIETPKDHMRRGSQVSLRHTVVDASVDDPRPHCSSAYAIVQALIECGVIGDFRAGDSGASAISDAHADLLRFGFAPAYLRFQDIWYAAEQLRRVIADEVWRAPRFQQLHAVT